MSSDRENRCVSDKPIKHTHVRESRGCISTACGVFVCAFVCIYVSVYVGMIGHKMRATGPHNYTLSLLPALYVERDRENNKLVTCERLLVFASRFVLNNCRAHVTIRRRRSL